jgi:signal transduction histidine kinase
VNDSDERRVAAGWPIVDRRRSGWATDWQASVEIDKAALAQSLHDNTGGLLVAAVMDITWAASRLSQEATDIRERLVRARAALDVAIGLNRRMIEDLRPTLLENFGLIAALKWHLGEACRSANIVCDQRLPEPGLMFSPSAAIAFYRIAQTLIAMMISHEPQVVMMELRLDRDFVLLRIRCEGASKEFTRENESIASALASVAGRTHAFGGDVQFITPLDGAEITCQLPASHALTVPSED